VAQTVELGGHLIEAGVDSGFERIEPVGHGDELVEELALELLENGKRQGLVRHERNAHRLPRRSNASILP